MFPIMYYEYPLSKYHSSLNMFLVEGNTPRLFDCSSLMVLVFALVQTIVLDSETLVFIVFRIVTFSLESSLV